MEETYALGIRCAASPVPNPKRPVTNNCEEVCGLGIQNLSLEQRIITMSYSKKDEDADQAIIKVDRTAVFQEGTY